MVKTKIVATLGPSSGRYSVLRKMVLAGMDVARINFSHGSLSEHKKRIRLVKKINKVYRRRIKILGDLEGHRIRTGLLKKKVELEKGRVFLLLGKRIKGDEKGVFIDYEGDFRVVKKGVSVFIDDGRIELKVIKSEKGLIKTHVVAGGELGEHKGINIPGAKLEFCGLTDKDALDIKFCVENKLDYIAQSFVRSSEDIEEVRELSGGCKVIAKIENWDGIRNIDSIMASCDGIMIARGDMGVSVPIYEVPVIQKEIIKKCNRSGKFVITATQMLERMVSERIPSRAEVTDVANAVLDGTDFVMLSAETAAGLYPWQAVRMMNMILKYTEYSKLKGRI